MDMMGLSDYWTKLQVLMKEKNDLRLLDLMAGFLIGISPLIHLIITTGINVPYGRFSSRRWGILINVQIAWFLQEAPALLIPMYLIFTSSRLFEMSSASVILLGLFLLHYVNRVFVYPFRIRGGKPTPILIAMFACTFCSYNGYMQGNYFINHAYYPSEWIYQPKFLIGICLFFWGMKTNIYCDDILRNLRKPGEKGYKIPHGDMFEYVTCGNFFGETVQWFGFALASWSLQATAFAIFVLLFLSAKGYTHHNWYLKKFEDYPKDRKIFIPFLI